MRDCFGRPDGYLNFEVNYIYFNRDFNELIICISHITLLGQMDLFCNMFLFILLLFIFNEKLVNKNMYIIKIKVSIINQIFGNGSHSKINR